MDLTLTPQEQALLTQVPQHLQLTPSSDYIPSQKLPPNAPLITARGMSHPAA